MTDQSNTRPTATAAETEEVSAAASDLAAEPAVAAAEAAAAEEPAPEESAPEKTTEPATPAASDSPDEPDKPGGPGLGGPDDQRSASSVPDKAAEYLELARRTQAAFDNYRKRMTRENAAAAERGASKLAKELLPALDHLDLALKAASGHEDVVRGFAMVHGELIAALGRVGIQSFSPEGEPFDPSEHEAMAQRPVEGAESGTVVEVYQQGYRINGTVLRPARVVVAQ